MSQNLSIDEATFDRLYPDLKGHYRFFNEPPSAGISKEAFEQTYLANKLWRLNNVYKIIDKFGNKITFRMNYAQHVVYSTSRRYPRSLILKSRQQGISTFWLVSMCDDAMFCSHLNIGLMAQGTDEATTLLERTKLLWDNLSDSIKQYMNLRLTKDNTKELGFSNGSNIFIRVSFRSATLQRMHISEFGKIANANPKRAKETKTGTLQALAVGNTGVIESTAEGDNDFKAMWDQATLAVASGSITRKDFYPVFLSWLDDPDCREEIAQNHTAASRKYFKELDKQGIKYTQEQVNFWIVQYRELGEDIYQEYPATPAEAFRASRKGTYYEEQFKASVQDRGGIISDLYDPNLPVQVFFDLGVDDYFVVVFVQMYRGKYRIIGEMWDNGKWLGYYLDYIFNSKFADSVKTLVFPHDIKQREQGAKGTKEKANTRLQIVRDHMRDQGYNAKIKVLKRTSEAEGIEAVKKIIPSIEIDPDCSYIISCFMNFTKEWDDKLRTWKKTPRQDEYIHGADVLRYIAQGTNTSEEYNATRMRSPTAYQRQNFGNRGHDV